MSLVQKFSSRRKTNNQSSHKNGKVDGSSASQSIITLVKRTPEDLNNSRCKAYSYLIP